MKPTFYFCPGCRRYYLIDDDRVEPGAGITLKDVETAYGRDGWEQAPNKSCGCNRSYVRIDINEGIPRIVECPDTVDVEIRDYDVEGGVADEAALLTDEDGAQYLLVGGPSNLFPSRMGRGFEVSTIGRAPCPKSARS